MTTEIHLQGISEDSARRRQGVPVLHVHLLGTFHLTLDDVPVTAMNSARLQSFFAYLVLHRETPQLRRDLAFTFWPDSTEAQAHTNLRKLLHELRIALPDVERYLDIDRQAVAWQPTAPFTLDVAAFEQTAARADSIPELESAVKQYHGDLLPSCYDDWIVPERERLRQLFMDVLEQLIARLEERRAYRSAIPYTQRLIQEEPVREESYLRLMRFYMLSGDRGGALRTYHACVTALARELEVEPSPAVRETYERLLNLDISAPPTPSALPRLIGRDREWVRLQAAWRAAVKGQPQVVLLTGEEGIGKTRLAEEMHQWVSRQGAAASSMRCFATDRQVPFAAVTTLLRARPLPHLDKVWLAALARLLPELQTQYPSLPAPRPLSEPGERQRFVDALAHAVLGTQPLLLVMDDLQECDADTLDWLDWLLHHDPHARLLVVGTLRWADLAPHNPLAALLPALRKDGLLTEVELGRLNESDTVQLASKAAGHALDATITARLYQETEGNPLFIVETVRAGSSPLGPEGIFPVPPTLQAIVESRLAQLSPAARELVDAAATLGRAFTSDELGRACEMGEEELVRALDELWHRRIIREHGADAYDFNHVIFRQVAYNAQSPAKRQHLKRRIAQALEQANS